MQSTDGTSSLGPHGPSLWSLISEHVPESELSMVRAAVGHFLVDMYTEIHAEAEMWYQMWQESQRSGSKSGAPPHGWQAFALADPPAIKELLRAEIKILLQSLRDRGSRGGRDGEELLHRYKPETVNYALGHMDTDCPSPEESRLSSRCSVQSRAEEEIQAVRNRLNVSGIDQVVERLRSILRAESEALNTLIKDLKGEIKLKCRRQNAKTEPSLAELKEIRGALQKDLELYPSSLDSSSTCQSPSTRELRTRSRPSPGPKKNGDETPKVLGSTTVLRPHPPLQSFRPRPPPSRTPSSQTCVSRAQVMSSEHRTPHRVTTSTPVNSHPTTNQRKVQNHLPCRPPSTGPGFRNRPESSTSVHEAQRLSNHCTSREDDVRPQRDRRTRYLSHTSHSPAMSPEAEVRPPVCAVSRSETPETQEGPKRGTSGSGATSGSLVAPDRDRKKISKSLYVSVTSEAGRGPAAVQRRERPLKDHIKQTRPFNKGSTDHKTMVF